MTPMRVAVAISFLLFAAPLTAQSTFTGANWRGWSEAVRLMYVVGYADGRSSGFFETLRMMDEKRWSKAVREGAEKDPQLKASRPRSRWGSSLKALTNSLRITETFTSSSVVLSKSSTTKPLETSSSPRSTCRRSDESRLDEGTSR
jgi:hypothetical protein